MRPNIQDLRYNAYRRREWEGDYWAQFDGILNYVSRLEDSGKQSSCGMNDCPSLPFNCEAPGGADGYGWQTSLCLVNGVGGSLWSGDSGSEGELIHEPWSINSTIYLVLSTNMRMEDWKSIDQDSDSQNDLLSLPAATDEGEWRSHQTMPSRFLNISLCFHDYPDSNVTRPTSSATVIRKFTVKPGFHHDETQKRHL
ncbi:hypothetical protein F5B20DRAFT_342937 [Whalleya microplaca]|nr:hypothetical protein F5B20DRAFT_342937 [Whalleya microplaca]